MLNFGIKKDNIVLLPYNSEIPKGYISINCTSWSNDIYHRLSPFMIRDMSEDVNCNIIENVWQFSKVYPKHDNNGTPSYEWYNWNQKGFLNNKPVRYTESDKNIKPLYFYYNNKKYDLIEARKNIYIPLYSKYVSREPAYKQLKELHENGNNIAIIDFGIKPLSDKYTIHDAINNRDKSMGHAYVLYLMLTKNNIYLHGL